MSRATGAYRADDNVMVRTLLERTEDKDAALLEAVGGDDSTGDLELHLLSEYGLRDGHHLIDVGCGSGRLSRRAARMPNLSYLGTDVVPELLAQARETSGRPDFRFETVTGLTIPEADNSADFVCFFSVVTHLLPEESLAYLAQARRVLRPGGHLVFSFLDLRDRHARRLMLQMVKFLQGGADAPHLNSFLSHADVPVWASMLNMTVVDVVRGGETFTASEKVKPFLVEPFVQKPHEQALAVLRKG